MQPAPKRARLNAGSSQDLVPLPGDEAIVHEHVAQLKRIGGAQATLHGSVTRPITSTSTASSTPTWHALETWEPVDSQDYALDPADGGWYDEAVDQDVTDEVHRPVVGRKKYSRSKVSVSPSFNQCV